MKLPRFEWTWPSWLPFQRWKVIMTVDSADEIPDQLPRRGAALVSSAGRRKWVAFDCPCGSGHRIMLNLDPSRKPAWQLDAGGGKLTIRPSVDYVGSDRRCHYHVRSGRIEWC